MNGHKLVWLVDATTYRRALPSGLRESKERYFRLKRLVRERRLGPHAPPGTGTFSVGLLRVATLLQAAGYRTRYLRAEDLTREWDEAEEIDRPDVIGFSAVTPTVPLCADLASRLRAQSPRLRVVLGGAHALAAPRATRARYSIFNCVSQRSDIGAARDLVGDDRALATGAVFVDYGLLPAPLRSYAVNVVSTVGCPFSCAYCQDRLQGPRPVDLLGQVQSLDALVPARSLVHLCDSVIGGSKRGADVVCRTLQPLRSSLLFSCDIRAEMIDSELVRAMSGAGFAELRVGLDASDERVLRALRRRLLPDELMHALEVVRTHADLYVSLYILTGLPGSSAESHAMNLKVVSALFESRLVDEVKHHLFVPYPIDTPDAIVPGILIRDPRWTSFDRQSYPVFELPGLSGDQIWADFLEMEEHINDQWARHFQISPEDERRQMAYPEYNLALYVEDRSR